MGRGPTAGRRGATTPALAPAGRLRPYPGGAPVSGTPRGRSITTSLASQVEEGDSVAVNGVCLTATRGVGGSFDVDLMNRTLAASNLAGLSPLKHLNLELAMQASDRLGGHIVQGHVDGTATILAVADGSAWRVVRFSLAPELAPLVARKGSIAVDGISLTVSAVSDPNEAEQWFEVSLIPETLTATTLGARGVGDTVNIETDIVARHVERMLALQSTSERTPASNAASGRSDA